MITIEQSNEPNLLKRDADGKTYREVRCPNCRAFICDEYIREGRIRLKCFRCGMTLKMSFRRERRKEPNG